MSKSEICRKEKGKSHWAHCREKYVIVFLMYINGSSVWHFLGMYLFTTFSILIVEVVLGLKEGYSDKTERSLQLFFFTNVYMIVAWKKKNETTRSVAGSVYVSVSACSQTASSPL